MDVSVERFSEDLSDALEREKLSSAVDGSPLIARLRSLLGAPAIGIPAKARISCLKERPFATRGCSQT